MAAIDARRRTLTTIRRQLVLVLMLVLVIVFAVFFKRIDHEHEHEHDYEWELFAIDAPPRIIARDA